VGEEIILEPLKNPHSPERTPAISDGTPLSRQQIVDLVVENIAANQERADEIEEERFQKSLKVKPSRYVE
jgi:hypothetical protein